MFKKMGVVHILFLLYFVKEVMVIEKAMKGTMVVKSSTRMTENY